jgi:hypothetical protein
MTMLMRIGQSAAMINPTREMQYRGWLPIRGDPPRWQGFVNHLF